MRGRRRVAERRSPGWRGGLGCSGLLSLLAALVGVLLALAYTNLSQGLPPLETLPVYLQPPEGLLLQPTRLYDRSGEHVLLSLENPDAAGRQYLYYPGPDTAEAAPATLIPSTLISATLASADPHFWNHYGFSLQGLFSDQHPTLAQRLVADLLLWEDPPGLRRALRERLLAAQITAYYGREQVLEWYLNSANYGRLAYGADAAARVYFARPAAELSLEEAALLVAANEAPALNPLDAPLAALERQKFVILAMLEHGFIPAEAAGKAGEASVTLRQESKALRSLAPAFTNLVLEQVYRQVDRSRLERGGLRIRTTLDYDLYLQTQCAAATQLARLKSPQAAPRAVDGSPCQAARLLPTLPASNLTDAELRAGVVVLDPVNGEILSLVGDTAPGLDPAHQPGRPAGSLLTPFVYLTAFTRGMGPASLVWDVPSGEESEPLQNFDGRFRGPLRLRMALANDYLVPALTALEQVGPENAWRITGQLGLQSLSTVLSPGGGNLPGAAAPGGAASQALDGKAVLLLEAAQAFGTIANQGTLVGYPASEGEAPTLAATGVQRVEDDLGRTWLAWETPRSRPVVTPQLAYLLTHVLSDEAARWPSLGHPNPLEIGRPAAAKIGRTLAGRDAWTVGYTPQLVVGVWVGYAGLTPDAHPGAAPAKEEPSAENPTNPTPEPAVSPNVAAGLWHAILQHATRDLPSENWNIPPGINRLVVCDPSGMLPTGDCPAVVNEVFLAGSEPNQTDTLYRRVQINRENGRQATVFTPLHLVEERVYLSVPPEAVEWARLAGLPVPPDDYEVYDVEPHASREVQIQSPVMFATLGGEIQITGRAVGENLAYFRVQVGKGLNPQTWLQVGEDVTTALETGELAVWDTRGLDGLFTVQLMVVRQDQSVEMATIQVTVDNTAPEVAVLYPAEGQEVSLDRGRRVTLRAQVVDNLEVQSVSFYVDNRLVGTVNAAPFALPWQAIPGVHQVRVEAVDRAGNRSEAVATFETR